MLHNSPLPLDSTVFPSMNLSTSKHISHGVQEGAKRKPLEATSHQVARGGGGDKKKDNTVPKLLSKPRNISGETHTHTHTHTHNVPCAFQHNCTTTAAMLVDTPLQRSATTKGTSPTVKRQIVVTEMELNRNAGV
jgi:hypothetical protein